MVCAAKSRRELMLYSVNVGLLGALLPIGAAPRPTGLGVQDYGGGVKQLNLCPPTPNCVSTSEAANDPQHFVPAWTYDAKVRRRACQRLWRVCRGTRLVHPIGPCPAEDGQDRGAGHEGTRAGELQMRWPFPIVEECSACCVACMQCDFYRTRRPWSRPSPMASRPRSSSRRRNTCEPGVERWT